MIRSVLIGLVSFGLTAGLIVLSAMPDMATIA